MRTYRTIARAGAAIAVTALVVTACSSGGSSGGSTTSGSTTSIGTDVNAIQDPSTKKGGTLNLADGEGDCDYWDPGRTYYGHCWDLQRFISRTVLTWPMKAGQAGATPVPDLAASMPVASNDTKDWTVKLKTGLKMQDGHVITAQDIKYAIARTYAPDVINGGPTYFSTLLTTGTSDYAGPYKDKNLADLKAIETPDDSTLVFHFKSSFSDFNYLMTLPQTAPVEAAKDTGAKYTFAPQSSGPYQVQSYTPNKSITLVRNSQWAASTDPNRLALPDKVTDVFTYQPDDVDQKIIANQIDSDESGTGVQIAAQAQILRDKSLQARSQNPVQASLRYMSIFTKVAPFDNVHCRKAVEWVIDRQAQVLARGGPIGGGSVATALLPPGVNGYALEDVYATSDSKGDIAKAKAELKLCGKPDGFSTTLVTRNSGKEVKQAAAVQADLKKIGINATIDQFNASQYFSAVIGIPANVHAKKYGLAMAGWLPDWPSAYAFFEQIVDGRAILQQGNSNYAEENNPVVNNAIDAFLATTDPTKQKADIATIDKTVQEDGAIVPMTNDKVVLIHSSRTTNTYPAAGFNGFYDYVNLGVEK